MCLSSFVVLFIYNLLVVDVGGNLFISLSEDALFIFKLIESF